MQRRTARERDREGTARGRGADAVEAHLIWPRECVGRRVADRQRRRVRQEPSAAQEICGGVREGAVTRAQQREAGARLVDGDRAHGGGGGVARVIGRAPRHRLIGAFAKRHVGGDRRHPGCRVRCAEVHGHVLVVPPSRIGTGGRRTGDRRGGGVELDVGGLQHAVSTCVVNRQVADRVVAVGVDLQRVFADGEAREPIGAPSDALAFGVELHRERRLDVVVDAVDARGRGRVGAREGEQHRRGPVPTLGAVRCRRRHCQTGARVAQIELDVIGEDGGVRSAHRAAGRTRVGIGRAQLDVVHAFLLEGEPPKEGLRVRRDGEAARATR